MNYKEKYFKYKSKYNKFKNQYGGLLTKDEIDNIKYQIINYEPKNQYPESKILNEFYEQELKELQNERVIEYVKKQRGNGKKIMLIVGAIPTQKDRFVIPDNFVPIFTEIIFGITWYSGAKFIHKEILTKSFEECPIIFYDILSPELVELNIGFDLITFDKSVCKNLDLTSEKLTNLFKLTYDNKSLIVIEGFGPPGLKYSNYFSKIDDNFPRCPVNISQSHKIKIFLDWFNLYLNNININTETYYFNSLKDKNFNINANFVNECTFNFILENTITNKNINTTSLLLYNQDIFLKKKKYYSDENDNKLFYLYFVNTKNILDQLQINEAIEDNLK